MGGGFFNVPFYDLNTLERRVVRKYCVIVDMGIFCLLFHQILGIPRNKIEAADEMANLSRLAKKLQHGYRSSLN